VVICADYCEETRAQFIFARPQSPMAALYSQISAWNPSRRDLRVFDFSFHFVSPFCFRQLVEGAGPSSQRWQNFSLQRYRYVILFSSLNNRHRHTLAEIFKNPVPSSIKWSDIEALLNALGAEVSEGNGSRVRIALNGVRAVFHRPHPQPTTDRGAVKSMRRFLTEAGVKP
jgi:hypothetical protein